MILDETYTLNNGVDIPKLGLGTWYINNRDVVSAVSDALRLGYRHIDTAQAYRNEAGVAEGVRRSGVARDEVFITTKLDAGAKSYTKAKAGIDRSLTRMGLDHLDLMIIHSPQPWTKFRSDNRYFDENREVWRALEGAYQAGKLRAIGLSNFDQDDVDNILDVASIQPAVNQVLAHIGTIPTDLISACQQHGILVEAYSPVAHGALLSNPDLTAIADRYQVTVPQLSIRYDLQLGLLPLPKTANPAHMRSNADLDFTITAEDMETLAAIPPVTDYGDASMMPVFGGQLNLRSVLSMLFRSRRS